MTQPRVAIQGIRASFHDVAAHKYFAGQGFSLIECRSFKAMGEALAKGDADVAIMAIENTIAGSLLPNYSLMERHGFRIQGETYLRIQHNLLALPGQELKDIKTVISHPMALAQCEEFLATLPGVRVQEGADTAESARDIRDRQMPGFAAIAGKPAAEAYGLHVVREGIETNQHNYTRFLAICRRQDYRRSPDADKTSISFEIQHRPGGLVEALELFRHHHINLTKIQSVPILGQPYQYSFHADLEWDDAQAYATAIAEVGRVVTNLIQFGEYPHGDLPAEA